MTIFGIAHVQVGITPGGEDRARAFYAKHGFAVVEERAACGSMQGVPTLVMRLPLEGR